MKRKNNFGGFSIVGLVLFFLTIAITSTATIIIFESVQKQSDNLFLAILAVIGAIIAGAMLCTLCDIYRRKTMIGKPVNMILSATEKIASGDFSIKLEPLHEYNKFDEYDAIFHNINTMTAELSKNEILKNDFISNVSHEIKTPLAVIQNYARALQTENDAEKKKGYLDGLIVQTKKLSDLITNILKLNKLENQNIMPEIEEFDLAEHLRICTLQFENLIEKKNLQLNCEIDEVKIVSSKSLLEIVFNNLISNAIKFTDNGGRIDISLTSNKEFAIIKIKDSGCGISSEIGQHIFEKFYQGDTSHSSEGNGLGLALVKKVIDILGGEISVESKVGEGSTFLIKLKKE